MSPARRVSRAVRVTVWHPTEMRYFLFAFFLLPAGSVFAQRSFVDVAGGLYHSYRRYASESQPDRVAGANERNYAILTGHLGLHYTYRLRQRLLVRTGLRISSLGYGTETSGLRWGSQHDGNGGFDPGLDPNQPSEFTARTERLFLDVPLLLHYGLEGHAWNPYLEVGLLPGIYLTRRVRHEFDRETTVTYTDETDGAVRRLQLGSSVALGVTHPLSSRYAIFVQGAARYQLTPLADGSIREHPFGVGLDLGLRRTLF